MRAVFAALALAAACGGAREVKAPGPTVPPLHTTPLTDLAPAASLAWLVEVHPREITAHAELLPAIELILPAANMRAFTARNGGVDPLGASEVVAAGYPATTLWLVRTPFDPARVEAAFGVRAVKVDARSVDWAAEDSLARITRVWGTVGSDRVQLALFGREALGLEVGRFAPLRAAQLFAEERLKRASPSLRASPLKEAAAGLGDAPFRAFAPGPFEGELAKGMGGILGAATAVAAAARPAVGPEAADAGGPRAGLAFTILVLGAWKEDAAAASERLMATYGLLASSSLGRLGGLDHPMAPPRVRQTAGALVLEVTLDAYILAQGLRDATAATVDEIMNR